MNVLKLQPPDIIELIDIENKLEELQEQVEGYIECVTLIPDKLVMVVNEEGLIRELPYNMSASIIARRNIVGNALIVCSDGEEFTDISKEYVKEITDKILRWEWLNE